MRSCRSVVFNVGWLTTLSSAVMVSAGAVPAGGVARVKSLPQAEPSPALPPGELTQAAAMSPIVLMRLEGTLKPEGTLPPGDVPEAVSTNCVASVKSCNREGASSVSYTHLRAHET